MWKVFRQLSWVLLIGLCLPAPMALAEPSGLLYTPAEVAIWRQRMTEGPYREEWQQIFANGTAWRNAPSPRVLGHQPKTCYQTSLHPYFPSHRRVDSGLMDAAFVYLLTADDSYRRAVRTALLAQVKQPGTNFADTSRFCPSREQQVGLGTDTGPWLLRLLWAYDFIRPTLSAAEQSTLEAWFHASAIYFERMIHLAIRKRLSGRALDVYTCDGGPTWCPGPTLGLSHAQGKQVTTFSRAWNNIAVSMNVNVAAVGLLVNDGVLKSRAKRFFKETIRYGVFPGGVYHDQYRWADTPFRPQRGFGYSGLAIGSLMTVADLFARADDPSLYTYTTTAGQFGTQGSPAKSLKTVMRHLAGQVNGTVKEYASMRPTTDPSKLIDHDGPDPAGGQRHEFIYLAQGNLFYRDAAVTQAYTRALPVGVDSSGYDPHKGAWGIYPGIRFMWGDLEGVVWPYP